MSGISEFFSELDLQRYQLWSFHETISQYKNSLNQLLLPDRLANAQTDNWYQQMTNYFVKINPPHKWLEGHLQMSRWNLQQEFVGHTSQRLLELPQKIDLLIHLLKTLKRQLFWYWFQHKIFSSEAISYSWLKEKNAKINEELAQLTQLKFALTEAMLMRLFVADASGELNCDDVVRYTLELGQKLEKIPNSYQVPFKKKAELTSEIFFAFIDYIQNNATKDQRASFLQLSWQQGNIETLIRVGAVKGYSYPVPVSFMNERDAALLKKIVFPVLTINKYFQTGKASLNKLDFKASIYAFHQCTQSIEELNSVLDQSIKKGFFSFFYSRQNKLISDFKKTMSHLTQTTLKNNACNLLKQLYQQLISKKLNLTNKEIHEIKQLLQDDFTYFNKDDHFLSLKTSISLLLKQLEIDNIFQFGIALMKQGQYESAIEQFEQCIKLDKLNSHAHHWLNALSTQISYEQMNDVISARNNLYENEIIQFASARCSFWKRENQKAKAHFYEKIVEQVSSLKIPA